MERVSITRAAAAHPRYRIREAEAAERIGTVTGELRKAIAIARGSQIRERALCLPPERIGSLGSIEERNSIYAKHAPGLALEGARLALDGVTADVRCLVTSSCTGYMVPGWDVQLVQQLPLSGDTVRLPITEAGCSAGVLGLARAADYLRTRPGAAALAVACELCSLAFQPSSDDGKLTSALIFGDGAGSAVLEARLAPGGLEIADSVSFLYPAPASTLGFELSDSGFSPLLAKELVGLVPLATEQALERLLSPHALAPDDIGFWLLHPGGARILAQLEQTLGIERCRTRWSWESMADFGNTSSAAVFDVLRRYLADPSAPGGWGVIAAFGPGVSVEMLLVRRC